MISRRNFLIGCASSLMTTVFGKTQGYAAPYGSGWVSGYGTAKGAFGIARIAPDLAILSKTTTPIRLHAIIRHPRREEICVPARRPGTQCIVIDADGKNIVIPAQKSRHFYGHGTYGSDGALLYLSENDYDNETGVIGVYDCEDSYRRLGELSSGGIGPHEILLAPDGKHLVVANGGIVTHPASGRAKLNLDTMAPNLSLLNIQSASVVANLYLEPELNNLSLRHLCQTRHGTIYFGLQNQFTEQNTLPLVGSWDGQSPVKFLAAPKQRWGEFKGYIGSLALDRSHSTIAAVSPHGGIATFWDCRSGAPISTFRGSDICGISPTVSPQTFIVSSGDGKLTLLEIRKTGAKILKSNHHSLRFDNHCTLV